MNITGYYFGFNYDVNENTSELTIYNNDNEVVATVSDCNDMKVDEVTAVTEDKITTFMMQDENTTYYGFHVIFKNKTDYWNNLSEINCTYTDDKGNEDIKAKRFTTSDMSGFTTEQVTYSGYIYCGLPNYTQDVNVKFENTTIQIKDYKELIK